MLVCAVLQDIAIVPFLVLLPLIEATGGMEGASADTLLQVSWARQLRCEILSVLAWNKAQLVCRTTHVMVPCMFVHCDPTSLRRCAVCCAVQMLGPTTATTLAGLGALLIGGRLVLRRVFEVGLLPRLQTSNSRPAGGSAVLCVVAVLLTAGTVSKHAAARLCSYAHSACVPPFCLWLQMVANSRSSEAFVAACLLTVGGSSLLTKQMGLSDTLGAFVAGVLLSETSFRTQVRAVLGFECMLRTGAHLRVCMLQATSTTHSVLCFIGQVCVAPALSSAAVTLSNRNRSYGCATRTCSLMHITLCSTQSTSIHIL